MSSASSLTRHCLAKSKQTGAPRLRVPLLKPLALHKVKTYPLAKRYSKVKLGESARPWRPGGAMTDFLAGLPDILAAKTLREVTDAIVKARLAGKAVVIGMGAHPTKVGLNPVLVDLMERRGIPPPGPARAGNNPPLQPGGAGGPPRGKGYGGQNRPLFVGAGGRRP